MVLGTVKLKHEKQYHIAFNAWKRCRKRVDVREEHYEEIHDRFPTRPSFSFIRNSKLAGPSRSASKWTSWHMRITPTVCPEMNSREIKNSGTSH